MLPTFALLRLQLTTAVTDSHVSHLQPPLAPTVSDSLLESRCTATRQVQGLGVLRFHGGAKGLDRWGDLEGRGRRVEEWGAVVTAGDSALAAGKDDLGAREG